jgi:DNA transformation protein
MSDFIEYLHEVFELFGPILVRKMFGGYGIYRNGLMFALVADNTLYLKADSENAGDFVKEGLGRFSYRRSGKVTQMSYYQAPAEIMEDREQAAIWAQRSFEAALRSQNLKQRPFQANHRP